MSIDNIGINNVLNLILVNEYIKQAYLIPECKYNENNQPNLLSEITKLFPLLKHNINYNIYDGVIISYNDYTHYNGSSVTLQNIGLFLGYPLCENFNNLTNNYNTYTINVNVKLKNGLTLHLFTNICNHITEYIIECFNIFIETAINAFNKEEYIKLLGEFAVIDVYTEIISNNSNSPDIIINKLINNIKLEDCDLDTIQHILINLNFSHNFQVFFNSYFQYTNKIHQGILLGIILNSKHYLLTPFQNIQNYKETYNDNIQIIVNEWETTLTHIIKQTHINNLFCLF